MIRKDANQEKHMLHLKVTRFILNSKDGYFLYAISQGLEIWRAQYRVRKRGQHPIHFPLSSMEEHGRNADLGTETIRNRRFSRLLYRPPRLVPPRAGTRYYPAPPEGQDGPFCSGGPTGQFLL